MSEILQSGDLPQGVINAAATHLSDYSIGFVRIESSAGGEDAVLLGSGTLICIKSKHVILTAAHVVSILPTTGRLGLVMSAGFHQDTVDTQGLTYLTIGRGKMDSDGPDLGAILLSPSIAGAIAARKSFYNLDLVREKMLHSHPALHDGLWFVNGFIAEYTTEEQGRDAQERVKGFRNISGAGGVSEPSTSGDFDYFVFPVSYADGALSPGSFGGMSGGGLWQVPLVRDTTGEIEHETPLLSGVVFYQKPTMHGTRGIRCHGRDSIYRVAYETIASG